jgi:hypothetical protein
VDECDPGNAAAVVGSAYGWEGGQEDAGKAFKAWQGIIKKNKEHQNGEAAPYAPLVEFFYGKAKLWDLD